MQPNDARDYVASLYDSLLRRKPGEVELARWVEVLVTQRTPLDLYYMFINSDEYKMKNAVKSLFPPGHYYSPVVDPRTITKYLNMSYGLTRRDIPGIEVPIDDMDMFWHENMHLFCSPPFPEVQQSQFRFYYDNNIFPYGDAITLRTMIAHRRPASVIEIGSGFSSACMLDTADEFGLQTKFTFIDPYAERLKSTLRANDYRRVSMVESPVQEIDLSVFTTLKSGDILFIDSTHVMKTGSDVHFELFYILPALAPGVLIHFHDIHFPFEYPEQWVIHDNYSWNEIYALRAFLMYNSQFKIRFWGNSFVRERTDLVRSVCPLFLKNPGGSIWIEKVSS
jgi:predicted O-methyltransferase YrrM